MILLVGWLSYVALRYLVVTLMFPTPVPGQIAGVPRRLTADVLATRRGDWLGVQANQNPRTPAAHYHRLGGWVRPDRFNTCAQSGCHAPVPHAERKELRAFLNLHATSMHCGICHVEPGASGIRTTWYDLDNGRAQEAPPALRLFAWLTAPDAQPELAQPTPATQSRFVALLREAAAAGDAIAFEEWPEDIGYLKVRRFEPETGSNLVARVSEWLRQGRSEIVLDLRACSGSDLESVDRIAGLFAPEGEELYVVRDFRGNSTNVHRAVGTDGLGKGISACIVALDGDTRGAAEILAAVLKGRQGVILAGWRTRGDMLVREWVEFGSNAAARVAVSRILLPGSGEDAGSRSIEPDVVVTGVRLGRIPERPPPGRSFSEKSEKGRELMRRVADDPVLGSAVDILLGLKATGFCGHSGEGGAAAR